MGGFFSPEGFTPRAMCGTGWSHGLVVLHVVSDLFILAAYVIIPAVLYLLFRHYAKRGQLPTLDRPTLICLLAFILSCGFTHAADAVMFFYPAYWASGVMLAICAFASVVSVAVLFMRLAREVSDAR